MRQMLTRSCSVDGCNGGHYARGWCQRHYLQWWRGKRLPEFEYRLHRTKVTPRRYV